MKHANGNSFRWGINLLPPWQQAVIDFPHGSSKKRKRYKLNCLGYETLYTCTTTTVSGISIVSFPTCTCKLLVHTLVSCPTRLCFTIDNMEALPHHQKPAGSWIAGANDNEGERDTSHPGLQYDTRWIYRRPAQDGNEGYSGFHPPTHRQV